MQNSAFWNSRQSRRLDVNLPVSISHNNAQFLSTMKDVSFEGAGFKATFALLKPGGKINVDTGRFGHLSGILMWRSSTGFGIQFDGQTRRSKGLVEMIASLES